MVSGGAVERLLRYPFLIRVESEYLTLSATTLYPNLETIMAKGGPNTTSQQKTKNKKITDIADVPNSEGVDGSVRREPVDSRLHCVVRRVHHDHIVGLKQGSLLQLLPGGNGRLAVYNGQFRLGNLDTSCSELYLSSGTRKVRCSSVSADENGTYTVAVEPE